jgi:hypothetical protein
MSKKFADQYDALGLEAPKKDVLTPQDKADVIFHAACKKLGYDPAGTPSVSHLGEEFQPSLIASYKLQVIRKVLIGEWKADYNNFGQFKWGAWFYMDSPGFRFSGVSFTASFANAGLGSRLCCETEEQAEFLARECIAFWADFYGGQLPA